MQKSVTKTNPKKRPRKNSNTSFVHFPVQKNDPCRSSTDGILPIDGKINPDMYMLWESGDDNLPSDKSRDVHA